MVCHSYPPGIKLHWVEKGGHPCLAQRRNFQVTCDPIGGTRRLFDLMGYQPIMTMRRCRQVLAVAIIFLATPSFAEPSHGRRHREHVQDSGQYPAAAKAGDADGFSDGVPDLEAFAPPLAPPVILVANETNRQEPDTDLFALMSGKCSTLKIAGRDFACRSVAYFHSTQGRAEFTIALEDPTDNSHIISFSGENGQRSQDNLYELPIDRMLLNSKNRPKVDGLPVPLVELSAGICTQLGNFAARQVSSISCTAMDFGGRKYELRFESDGSPIILRRVRQSPPTIRQHPFK